MVFGPIELIASFSIDFIVVKVLFSRNPLFAFF